MENRHQNTKEEPDHSDLKFDQCVVVNIDSRSDAFPQDAYLSSEDNSSLSKGSSETSESAHSSLLNHSPFFTDERKTSTAADEFITNNIRNFVHCSEDDLISFTFEVCKTKETGLVPASVLIKYLEDVTGQNHENCRLLLLYNMLDPERQNIFIDRETFHATMKNWIAMCSQDCISDKSIENKSTNRRNLDKNRGNMLFLTEEDAETFQGAAEDSDMQFDALTSSVADLKYMYQKLTGQVLGTQKAMEVSDEICLQLMDEVAELKRKLIRLEQYPVRLKCISNELEDFKSNLVSFCEENHMIHGYCRSLKKQVGSLSTKLTSLEEIS